MKQVIVTAKVSAKVRDALKKEADSKGMKFSAFIVGVLSKRAVEPENSILKR